jgi:hypothetical protein
MSAPSPSLRPYVRQATEHQRLAYAGGAELAVILDAAITGGQLTVIDSHSPPRRRVPRARPQPRRRGVPLPDGQMTVWVGENATGCNSAGSGSRAAPSRTQPAAISPPARWCCPPR